MAKKVINKCKHKDLMYLDNDTLAENKVYDDNNDIIEYDDYKLFIFNCNDCGEIIVKKLLRSHFKRNKDESQK